MSSRLLLARTRRALAAPGPADWQRMVAEGTLVVGRGTYGVEALRLQQHRLPDGTWVGGRLLIGRYCSLNSAEIMLGGNHRTEWVSQYPFASRHDLSGRESDASTRGDVVIGNDVWLAAGAIVLSGVQVGDGAVLAEHAVVTKDVRPYAIVAGNPACEVRRRFDDATVERVHRLRWWDWPEKEILQRYRELNSEPDGTPEVPPT